MKRPAAASPDQADIETIGRLLFAEWGWMTRAAETMCVTDRQLRRVLASSKTKNQRNISAAPMRLLEDALVVKIATAWIRENPSRLTAAPDPRELLSSKIRLERTRRRGILDRAIAMIRACGYPSRNEL